MKQKKKQGFLRVLWLLHTPKRLRCGHLLRPESESDRRRPDPSKKVQIRQDPQHFSYLPGEEKPVELSNGHGFTATSLDVNLLEKKSRRENLFAVSRTTRYSINQNDVLRKSFPKCSSWAAAKIKFAKN
jgi:hypothetical protein